MLAGVLRRPIGAVDAVAYADLVDALTPHGHWRFDETSGTTAVDRIGGRSATLINAPILGVDPLVRNAAGGRSIGLKAGGTPAYVTVTDLVTSAAFTLDVALQVDEHPGAGGKYLVATTGGGSTPGEVSIELQDDGAFGLWVRCWSVDDGGTPIIRHTGTGTVPIGTAFKLSYRRDADGTQSVLVDGVVRPLEVESGDDPASWSATPSTDWYLGIWPSLLVPFKGLMAELVAWQSAVPDAAILSLARARSVVWLGDFDAGSVAEGATMTIGTTPHAFPTTGLAAVKDTDGDLGTVAAHGAGFDYTAGASGGADSFTGRVGRGGSRSQPATIAVTIDAEPAADLVVTPSDADSLIPNASEGDVIELEGGTYNIGTITPKNGQTYRGKAGETVVLDGQAQNKRAFAGGATDVTIKRLTIRHYWNGFDSADLDPKGGQDGNAQIATIHPNHGEGEGPAFDWTIEDCTFFENYGGGIKAISGLKVRRCTFETHGMCAIAGRGGEGDADDDGIVVEDCDITDSCRWRMNVTWESGGIKFAGGTGGNQRRPTRYTVRRCRIWDNFGPGIWFDWNVMRYEVTRCSIYRNRYSGIVAEAAADGDIHHNQIGENGINGHGFASFDCEFSFQNTKLTRFRDNLVVVDGAGNVHWLGQQNRSGDSPQGGAHIGHFVATQNEISGNVYVLKDNANWAFVHDSHGCANSNVNCTGESCSSHYFGLDPGNYPGNLVDEGFANAYCFCPQKGEDQHNSGSDNTYRLESGSPSPYGFMSGTTISESGATDGLTPDWTQIPTWPAPPGKVD